MATDVQPETDVRERQIASSFPIARQAAVPPRRKRPWAKMAAVAVGIGAILATAWLMREAAPRASDPKLTHTVTRGELLVTVTEDGALQSGQNKDIKCQVAGGSTILRIVEDGTVVKPGDILVELDASAIEDKVSEQKITYQKALATYIQAESDLAVAEINLSEYLDGTYRQEMQTAESNVAISEESLRVAQNVLEYTERMHRKGYVSSLELAGKEYSVQHATLELALMKTAVDVLQRFTKPKMLQDLQSKLKAARAKLDSEKAALDLEKVRLTRLEEQRDGCVIRAENAGMVIYPETEEWRDQPSIEEGSAVREQQTILQLPDLEDIQVKVDIHESKVEQLTPGMPANIQIQDKQYKGKLLSVANRAEQTSWWRGDVRQFKAIVRVEDHQGVKPGMSAKVEILVAHHKDVLTVPVAAVVEHGSGFHCWVKDGHQTQRRSLVLGASNDQFMIVKDGLSEGDQVVLNPRAMIEEARLEALTPVVDPPDPISEEPPAAEDAEQGTS